MRTAIGFGLYEAQSGDLPTDAKPLKGFKGAGVVEIIEDHDGDTYRAVYTVRFGGFVFVLHAFQKKSTRGISTPKRELDLIHKRLADAGTIYRAMTNGE